VGRRRTPAGRGGALVVALVIAASLLFSFPDTARAATRVPGIDVSKWQGNVDWAEVASTSSPWIAGR
jgi:hypothetical protein